MDWHAAPTEADRRRRLQAFSRHAETPRQLVMELTADGTDYMSLGTVAELEFEERWRQLRVILEAAPRKLTRRALLARWPRDERPPDPVTVWRWLDRAVARGLLRREGTGRKNDPFRFWLPDQEERLRRPPWERELADLTERLSQFGDPPGEPPAPPPVGPG
jgi:hypothetical protein